MRQETLNKYAGKSVKVTIHLKWGGAIVTGEISPISEWDHSDEVKINLYEAETSTFRVGHFDISDIFLLLAEESSP